VVFLGEFETVNKEQLYSAPIATANSRVDLSGTVVSGGRVLANYRITPDSSRVVYIGDLVTDNVFELFSSPIAIANSRVSLSGTPISGGGVTTFELTPNGSRAVFFGDVATDQVFELYSAPVNGATARIRLSGSAVSGGNVFDYVISPDSNHVVFRGDLLFDNQFQLFSAPVNMADTRVTISGTVPLGDAIAAYAISPDSSRVVILGALGATAQVEVYSAPISVAGGRIALSSGISPIGFGSSVVNAFKISPDSSRVVFAGDLNAINVRELYSAPIASSGAMVKISATATANGDVSTDFEVTRDSQRVLFRGDLTIDGRSELYSAPIAMQDARASLSGSMVSGSNVINFRQSNDGSRVIFLADLNTDSVVELYRVQVGGSALALDIDGDDRVLPLTDLLLLTRYQLGIRGSALIANALGENATITGSTAIENRIRAALGVGLPF
jgi:hypothetical protein